MHVSDSPGEAQRSDFDDLCVALMVVEDACREVYLALRAAIVMGESDLAKRETVRVCRLSGAERAVKRALRQVPLWETGESR